MIERLSLMTDGEVERLTEEEAKGAVESAKIIIDMLKESLEKFFEG